MSTALETQNRASLTTFARFTLIATIAGAILSVLAGPFVAGYPLIPFLALCAVGAGGAATSLYLLKIQSGWRLGSYVLVAATILTISIALTVTGSGVATANIFVYPVAVAGLLLGGRVGVVAAAAAFAAYLGVALAEYMGILVPTIPPNAAPLTSGFNTALALGLAAAAVIVAGGNNQQALSEAEVRAQAEENVARQLAATFAREEKIKAELQGLAGQLAGMSTAQDTAARQAATGISQVTAQTAELSTAAAQIETAAKNIRAAGENTAALVSEVITRSEADRIRFSQVLASGQQTQTFATELGRSVKQMSQILGLIESVVEEIQMLSINATIEATGAGETGRRFGVIATEVGKLGERVGDAAHDIAAVVGRVQAGAAALVPSASRTVADINATIAAASITAQQLAEVSSSADEAAREGFAVSGATMQQLKVTTDIAAAMSEVSRLADDLAHSSTDLAVVAGTLTESVGRLAAVATPATQSSGWDDHNSTPVTFTYIPMTARPSRIGGQ